jgi:hypothetical protein
MLGFVRRRTRPLHTLAVSYERGAPVAFAATDTKCTRMVQTNLTRTVDMDRFPTGTGLGLDTRGQISHRREFAINTRAQ